MVEARGKAFASEMLRVKSKGFASVRWACLAREKRSKDEAVEEKEAIVEAAKDEEVQNNKGNDNSEEGEGNNSTDNNKGNDNKDEDGSKEGDNNEEGESNKDIKGNKEAKEVEFDVDNELVKLSNPPLMLIEEDFMKKYGFKDEGYLSNCLTKWPGKRFDYKKCVAIFGKAMETRRCHSYN